MKRTSTRIAAIAFVVGAVMAAGLFLSLGRASSAQHETEQHKLAQVATVLADRLAAEPDGAVDVLRQEVEAVALTLPSLEYVIIRNAGGRPIVRWERVTGRIEKVGEKSTEVHAHKKHIVRDSSGEPIGSLSLALSRGVLGDSLASFQFAVYAVIVATILLTLLLGATLRRFERAEDERVDERTAELRGEIARIEYQYKSKNAMFKKFSELVQQGLIPARAELRDLINAGKNSVPEGILRTNQTVTMMLEQLEPLALRAEAEAELRHKKVILAASVKTIRRAMRTALAGTGVELSIPETLKECEVLIEQGHHDVICADAEFLPLVLQCKGKKEDAKIVFMTDHGIGESMPLLKENPSITNLVAYNSQDINGAIRSLLVTVGKIVNDDLFGFEKYLSWGLEAQELELNKSGEREAAEEQMTAYFESIGIRKGLRRAASLAAEEMLMNAVYDAPVDNEGKSLFNHLSRLEPVTLPGDDKVRFRYACDGLMLAVSVTDPYGSLGRDTIVEYLERNYNDRPGHKAGVVKGGAGRGIFMMTEASDLVVFNVEKGVQTEVIAFFYLSQEERKGAVPMFHYFAD